MRKLLAFVFWIFTTALYVLNIMFLIYLIGRTFQITILDGYMVWFAGLVGRISPNIALTTYELWSLWLIYLFICTPIVAFLQYYGKNLGDRSTSFPLLKTLFGVLAGILKIIITVALLCAAIYFVFEFLI